MRTDYHRLKVSNDFCSGLPQQGDNVVFCLISPLRAHVFRRKDLFVIFLDLFAEKTNEKMLFCSVLLQKELRFFVSVQVELQTLKKKKLQLVLAALLNIAEYPPIMIFCCCICSNSLYAWWNLIVHFIFLHYSLQICHYENFPQSFPSKNGNLPVFVRLKDENNLLWIMYLLSFFLLLFGS